MGSDLGELIRGLPPLLASHLELTVIALIAAVVISLPLAVVVAPRPRPGFVVVTAAGLIQTVPGLALLALMVAVLSATDGLGLGLASFGFAPAVIALTLYAILPILRNAVTGLAGVDPAAVEAARGMGMAPRQVLLGVQLPLAAPVIAAGIRTAAVWTVGAATLATPVGQPCLGNYIFAGLQTRNTSMLLVGVAAAAALAVVLDLALGAVERSLAGRRRRRAWLSLAALAALIATALIAPRITRGSGHGGGRATAIDPDTGQRVVTRVRIGGKTFSEQYILMQAMRRLLEAQGITVEVVESLGSTVVFDALVRGDVDVYVDYSGTIWANYMRRPSGVPRWQVLAEVEGWLASQHGVRSLGPLGFENAYALAVRRATAERHGLGTIADLAGPAGGMAIGGDYEFFSRSEWASVRDTYRLGFARQTSFDPTFLYDAVTRGDVDVISAFSSDGRIAAHDLVVLSDPAGALPPYDAMILLGPGVAGDARVACALSVLRGAIPVELMRDANLLVDRDQDKQPPARAAAHLLDAAGVVTPRCAP